MEHQDTLTGYIAQSLQQNWELTAFTDWGGKSLLYRDVARKIVKLHLLFENAGLKPGDKIAICGRNCQQWAVVALASLTYGTIVVPILNDFKPDNVHHLVCHSEARLFFVDSHTWEHLDHDNMPMLVGVILLDDFSLLVSRTRRLTAAREQLNQLFGQKYPGRFTPADVKYPAENPDATAVINYTSGSTGFSKGVVLSYRAMWSNIQFCIDGLDFLRPGDGMVSILPLAHMFGFTVELIHPFVKGCHTTFLGRTPAPATLLAAFAQVKPKLVVSVPLIIEKIVRTKVFPQLEKPMTAFALHLPLISDKIYAKVKQRLIDAFGGNLQELIIGGAAISKDVEKFLRRIKFPYTVGYGMTECGPLIAYCQWDSNRAGSCGKIVDRMEARIDSPDGGKETPGVLYVRGANVMKGYYKNIEATNAIFDDDGWMNTGDICTIDADGYVYIRGRDKTMILGPSGQNIYPEEIEQQLNNMPYVQESLIVENSGRLVALIYPDFDGATRQNITMPQIEDIMRLNVKNLNAALPAYSQISDIKILQEEFEKTPKRSIKRYLYTAKK